MKNSELRLAIMQKRLEEGWSQTTLAEKLKVSQKSVSMWENGETVPRGPMRIRLAQVFGLPIDYFFETDEDTTKEDNNENKTEITEPKSLELSKKDNEVTELAIKLLNAYSDEHIELLITKLNMYR